MREDLPAVDDRDDLVPPSHRPHQAQVLDGPLHGLSEEGGQEGFMLKTDEGERVKTPNIQRIIGVHEPYSYGLFSIGQIERILKILKREKKYLDEPNLQIWFEFQLVSNLS